MLIIKVNAMCVATRNDVGEESEIALRLQKYKEKTSYANNKC